MEILIMKENQIEEFIEKAAIELDTTASVLKFNNNGRKSGKQDLLDKRTAVMFVALIYSGLTLGKIGQIFGNRDHSTIMHNRDKILYNTTKDGRPVVSTLQHYYEKCDKIAREIAVRNVITKVQPV